MCPSIYCFLELDMLWAPLPFPSHSLPLLRSFRVTLPHVSLSRQVACCTPVAHLPAPPPHPLTFSTPPSLPFLPPNPPARVPTHDMASSYSRRWRTCTTTHRPSSTATSSPPTSCSRPTSRLSSSLTSGCVRCCPRIGLPRAPPAWREAQVGANHLALP
jgi:hypothetical protein